MNIKKNNHKAGKPIRAFATISCTHKVINSKKSNFKSHASYIQKIKVARQIVVAQTLKG
jgi:hypothetical protein